MHTRQYRLYVNVAPVVPNAAGVLDGVPHPALGRGCVVHEDGPVDGEGAVGKATSHLQCSRNSGSVPRLDPNWGPLYSPHIYIYTNPLSKDTLPLYPLNGLKVRL